MKLKQLLYSLIVLLQIIKYLKAYRDWENLPAEKIDNVLLHTNKCATISKKYLEWDIIPDDDTLFIITKDV